MKRFLGLIVMLLCLALAVPGYCGTTDTMGRQDSDDNYTIETDSDHVVQLSDNASIKSAGAAAVLLDDDIRINGALNFGVDSVGTDAYSITLDPAPTAIATGTLVMFVAGTNNTGACTLDIDGSGTLAAKSLKSLYNQTPADSYISTGSVVLTIYDGTNFQILTPDSNP